MEEIFPFTAHNCTVPDRNNTHIRMLFTTDTDGVYLYKSVMEVADNFVLEINIVDITSDGGGSIWVYK